MAGAGFQQAAASSLRNNRTLRRGSGNYFNTRNAKAHRYIVRKNEVKASNGSIVSKIQQERSYKKRIMKLLGIIFIVLAIFYGIIALTFFIGNLEYRTYIGSKIGSELNEKALALKQYDYHAWVRTGDEYLYFQQLDKAQNAYIYALRIFPNGRKANEGLSEVLNAKCEKCDLSCEEAIAYQEKMEA